MTHTNGIKISPGGPCRRQADQPPNGLGGAFRAGSAGLPSLENGPKTVNLMPLMGVPGTHRTPLLMIEMGNFPRCHLVPCVAFL